MTYFGTNYYSGLTKNKLAFGCKYRSQIFERFIPKFHKNKLILVDIWKYYSITLLLIQNIYILLWLITHVRKVQSQSGLNRATVNPPTCKLQQNLVLFSIWNAGFITVSNNCSSALQHVNYKFNIITIYSVQRKICSGWVIYIRVELSLIYYYTPDQFSQAVKKLYIFCIFCIIKLCTCQHIYRVCTTHQALPKIYRNCIKKSNLNYLLLTL